jgi:hypothetical protein
MQALTRDEFLELLGVTSGAFDQLQHAGHVALAFGTPIPGVAGRYLDLDLVAMALNLALSVSLGRARSTVIVAAFFHQWARAVGYAEAEPNHDFFFAVAGRGWDEATKGPKVLLITHGTLDEIRDDFKQTQNLVGYFTVNISDIIRRLRARAHSVGIDLSRPFFFRPDDPGFEQIVTQAKRERDARIARLRQDKKKFATAKKRRYGDIVEAPRVRNIPYPSVLQHQMEAIFGTAPLER